MRTMLRVIGRWSNSLWNRMWVPVVPNATSRFPAPHIYRAIVLGVGCEDTCSYCFGCGLGSGAIGRRVLEWRRWLTSRAVHTKYAVQPCGRFHKLCGNAQARHLGPSGHYDRGFLCSEPAQL